MIEIIFTCWLVFMSDGSAYCYCDNEPAPVESLQVVERETPEIEEAPPVY